MFLTRLQKGLMFVAIGVVVIAVFLVTNDVFAQTLSINETGVQDFAASGVNTQLSLTIVIARMLRAFFGLLGIVAVGFIVYGGWLWMTAGGKEENVDKAKKVIINGIIGMAIILSSFAIASFVVGALVGSVGDGGGSGSGSGNAGGGGCLGCFGTGSDVVVKLPSNTKAGFIDQFTLYFFKDFGKPAYIDQQTVVKGKTIFLYQNKDGKEVLLDFDVTQNANTLVIKPKSEAQYACPTNSKGVEYCFENDGTFKMELVPGGSIAYGMFDEEGDPLTCTSAFPCKAEWSIGHIDDSTPPNGAITQLVDQLGGVYYTGSTIPVERLFTGYGEAQDDVELKHVSLYKDDVLFEVIPFEPGADGYYPSQGELVFKYDTKGMAVLTKHRIGVDITDSSNNVRVGDGFHYTTAGLACFNGVQDGDEQGVDCGGASCQTCSVGACTLAPPQCTSPTCANDNECASGFCSDVGLCVDGPVIQGVFLNNGAAGNYIQIVGRGFGVYGANAKVMFIGDQVSQAPFVQCPGSGVTWNDTQIIVEVPAVVQGDYAIKVITQVGLSDTTDGGSLPLLPDFNVNNSARPGIACVKPDGMTAGNPLYVGSSISIHGKQFGSTQEAGSKVEIGSIAVAPSPSNAWGNTLIQTKIPNVFEGTQSVVVQRAGIDSNPYNVVVGGIDEDSLPVIGSVFPANAKRGDMLTITGTGFGNQQGSVFFGTDNMLADTEFPEQCSALGTWSSSQIVVKVPESLPVGNQGIVVERIGPVAKSDSYDYVIEDGVASANLCALYPNNGPVGTPVALYGENFGSDGSVVFNGNNAVVTGWSQETIDQALVPQSTLSGDVRVTPSGGKDSNPLQFIVNDCTQNGCLAGAQICCTSGTAVGACVADGEACPGTTGDGLTAAYEWTFSTGVIPTVPRLLYQCDLSAKGSGYGAIPSPSPFVDRNGGDQVCVNSKISAVLSTQLLALAYKRDVVVERCGDKTCAETTMLTQPGDLVLKANSIKNQTLILLVPSKPFEPKTTYRVTLSQSIASKAVFGDSVHMAKDPTCDPVVGMGGQPSACWTFTTRAAEEVCGVDEIRVAPALHITDTLGPVLYEDSGNPLEWRAFAFGEDACVLLQTNTDGWYWETQGNYASAAKVEQQTGILSDAAYVTAVNGLPEGSFVDIAAEYTNTDGKVVSGKGLLGISQDNPSVSLASPMCSLACTTAPATVEFSQPVDSVGMENWFTLHECYDESCKEIQYDTLSTITPVELPPVQKEDGTMVTPVQKVYRTVDGGFKPGTWYRAIVKGGADGVKSVAGLTLAQPNYGEHYSWTFRTRDADESCEVDHVILEPKKSVVGAVGDMVSYLATPYSVGDACSADGQALTPWDYDWQWSVVNQSVADIVDGGVDTGKAQPWCSASGILAGSYAYPAVCGDGVVNPQYEECDDGNSVGGDDCSANCLHEGVVSVFDLDGAGGLDGGTCGNAVPGDPSYKSSIDNPAIEGFEECDDGNAEGGDGCSAICLNEGSLSGGSVCGNGDVGPGEDCDDGNTVSGDGCSSTCLYEGSPRYDDECYKVTIHSSVSIKKQCEGNVIWASCGNGVVEKSEACDDENVINGDGCSSACLLEPTLEEAFEDLNVCTPVYETDGFTDPVQHVVAIGEGSVDTEMLQSTTVKAQMFGVQAKSSIATADFAIQCGYEYGSNCGQYIGKSDSLYAVSQNSCCQLRPQLVDHYPKGTNACLNSEIYVDVDKSINTGTLENNAHLYDTKCAPGDPFIEVAGDFAEEGPWYVRWWQEAKRFALSLIASPARALGNDVVVTKFCPSDVAGTFSAVDLPEGGSRISYQLEEFLDASSKYLVVLDGGSTGVKTTNGLPFYDNYVYIADPFVTATNNVECALDHIDVTPDVVQLNAIHENEDVFVQAYTKNGAQITPIPGLYDWTYAWALADQEPKEDVVLMSGDLVQQRSLSTNDTIGSAVVVATAELFDGNGSAEVGTIFDDETTNIHVESINKACDALSLAKTSIDSAIIHNAADVFALTFEGEKVVSVIDTAAMFNDRLSSVQLSAKSVGLYGTKPVSCDVPDYNISSLFVEPNSPLHDIHKKLIDADAFDPHVETIKANVVVDKDAVFSAESIQQLDSDIHASCEQLSLAKKDIDVVLGQKGTGKPALVQTFKGEKVVDIGSTALMFNEVRESLLTLSAFLNASLASQDMYSCTVPAVDVAVFGSEDTSFWLTQAQAHLVDSDNADPKISPSTVLFSGDGTMFTDYTPVSVFVCEKPWPENIKTLNFGFADVSEQNVPGYNELLQKEFGEQFNLGSLRTNFGFSYCRDRGVVGDTSDDLPLLHPIVITSPSNPQTTLKEFFFQPDVPGNKDVIGLRIEKNPHHLPLLSWYASRGFGGNPTQTFVGGFPALQDGRTLYVSAVNASAPNQYAFQDARTNVYVLSYNQGATASTLAIFEQIVARLKFMINITNTAHLCYFDADVQGAVGQQDMTEVLFKNASGYVSCVSDLDCAGYSAPAGFTSRCAGVKSKITRDLRRIDDLRTIDAALLKYYVGQGSYPPMTSGTFVPGRSVSTWGSWQSKLSNNLGIALPQDPINTLVCEDGLAEDGTCWNPTTQLYACAEGSHAYEYGIVGGGTDYELRSQFELPVSLWTDHAIVEPRWVTDNVCTGVSYGSSLSSVCGNKIVETGELCDPPGIGKKTEVFVGDGKIEIINSICTNACLWEIKGSVTIDACGNGRIDDDYNELCDDGGLNGQYGYCSSDCQARAVCGDGIVQSYPAGPEICDPTSGTDYALKKVDSCNWDCRDYGSYCGDGVKQTNESCDPAAAPLVDPDHACPSGQVYQSTCSNTCEISWSCVTAGSSTVAVEPIVPSCGDGNLDAGEACDLGAQNDYSCVAAYGNPPQSCSFCHADSCQIKAQTGGFCGDEVANGSEQCDAQDFAGGAFEACLALGYDYGAPTCNDACSEYSTNGCTYCGAVEGTGQYNIQGRFVNPAFIDPVDRILPEYGDVDVLYNGGEPLNDKGYNEQSIGAGGVYGFYLDAPMSSSGQAQCNQYQLSFQSADGDLTSDVFAATNETQIFNTFYSQPSKMPHKPYIFVVEWPAEFDDLDIRLSIASQGSSTVIIDKDINPLVDVDQAMKQVYLNDPSLCLSSVFAIDDKFAPLSCERDFDGNVYASYLYDNTTQGGGYETFSVLSTLENNSILIGDKPTAYMFQVSDVDGKKIMNEHLDEIRLHVFYPDDTHQMLGTAKPASNNISLFTLYSENSGQFILE